MWRISVVVEGRRGRGPWWLSIEMAEGCGVGGPGCRRIELDGTRGMGRAKGGRMSRSKWVGPLGSIGGEPIREGWLVWDKMRGVGPWGRAREGRAKWAEWNGP